MSLQLANRESGDSSNGNDKIAVILKFIYTFGIPAVIAIYLIWFMSSKIDNSLTQLSNTLQAHQIESAKDIEIHEVVKDQISMQTLILQSICANTAKNSTERVGCFKSQ